MNPPPDRCEAIFVEALRQPVDTRSAYLEEACAGDEVLRCEVERLLAAHVSQVLTRDDSPGGDPAPAAIGEKPGDYLGPYRLLQQIGEGGCGVVYMAEQITPVRRRVALKIIKAGMDTRQVIARFEAERQALALMDHPAIAKIFDAGATPAGRPYFVMELVRGVKITDYCDQQVLTTEDRLRLFVQVCQAIQHAHQKGVIHRDLKPSNILVTTNEAGGAQPVVIDFGLARTTMNQRLTDKTLFSAVELMIGTPAYMSPEQTAAGPDVDTRSDIYSLGVLLYELLTGSTPFGREALLKAGLDEVRRTIQEQDPLRPSVRLSRMSGEELSHAAQRRRAEVSGLIHAVHGDLDWIALKALEKDRRRRYDTAEDLAMDIRSFLADEVVSAHPPSLQYRFQKAVGRNKLWFAGSGVVALLLVVSLLLVSRSLARERLARQDARAAQQQAEANQAKARAESLRSQQVTRFIEDMLQGVGPSVALGRDTTMLREILDAAAGRIGPELDVQPAVKADLQNKIGGVYLQLARYDQAEAMHRAALEAYRKIAGGESRETAAARSLLALVEFEKGELPRAESGYREVLALQRKLFGPEHLAVAEAMKDLATALLKQGKFAEGVSLRREALEMRRRLLGKEGLDTTAYRETLQASVALATEEGRANDAETAARELLASARRTFAPGHPRVAAALSSLSTVLGHEGKLDEAEATYRQVLELRRALVGELHPDYATSLYGLGVVLHQQGRWAEAETSFRTALSIMHRAQSRETPIGIDLLRRLGATLRAQGRLTEAEALHVEAVALGRKVFGDEHSFVARLLADLATVLADEKKLREAEDLLNGFLTPALLARPQSAAFLKTRAEFFARQKRWREAAADASLAVEYRPTDTYYYVLAPLLARAGDVAAYERYCRTAVAPFAGTKDPQIAYRMAKSCLLLPSSDIPLRLLKELAETAASAGSGYRDLPFFQGCRAMAEYRQGNYTSALDWARKPLQKNSPLFARLEAYAVLAMAHAQLHHAEAARSALAEALTLRQAQRSSFERDDAGDDWQEWICVQLWLEEAANLLASLPSTGSPPRKV